MKIGFIGLGIMGRKDKKREKGRKRETKES